MNLIFKSLIFFALLFVHTESFAQQNLFNIPSADITPNKKFFYQHQLNIYSNKLESKAHLVYGIGKGWDIGINLVGKGFYFDPQWRGLHNDNPNKGALYPILMGTVQKQFTLDDHFNINLGTQIGWNLSNKLSNKKLNHFSYAIGSYHTKGGLKIVAGLYNTNQMYVGNGNTFGAMGGFELKLSKKLYLMGDWVSGRNDAAVSVIGGMYNVTKRFQLCAGWQIPNPNTPKPSGMVFEINLMGWNAY